MSGATLISGGTYLLELSTGYDSSAFTLDSSLLNGTDVLDGDGLDYVDISDLVQDITVRRGRRQPLDVFGPGTMNVSIAIENTNRTLDPFNTSSAYYNTATSQPGLAPLRDIRLSRNGDYIFTGKITAFNQQYTIDGLTNYSVTAADDIYVLSQGSLPATSTSVETSSARIATVLTAADYTGTTSLTGSPTATLGAFTIASGTNVNAYLNRIQQAEQGRIFCSRTNVLTAQPRIGTTLATPTVEFTDDGGAGTDYDVLIVEFDQQAVINNANITIEGGTLQNASDAGSIDEYFTQTIAITDSLLSSDAQALTLASYLLEPIPLPRFTSVSTSFVALTNKQKTDLAELEIGDTISVTKTFTSGTPELVNQTLSVEGIEHRINVATGHRITVFTAATTVLSEFILDDITYGTLNGNNSLG